MGASSIMGVSGLWHISSFFVNWQFHIFVTPWICRVHLMGANTIIPGLRHIAMQYIDSFRQLTVSHLFTLRSLDLSGSFDKYVQSLLPRISWLHLYSLNMDQIKKYWPPSSHQLHTLYIYDVKKQASLIKSSDRKIIKSTAYCQSLMFKGERSADQPDVKGWGGLGKTPGRFSGPKQVSSQMLMMMFRDLKIK